MSGFLFDVDGMAAPDRRVKELEALIVRYQNSYYNGEAEISDAEFDSLWDELKRLNPSDPLLSRVGADSGDFVKIRHIMPMGSQEKAADPPAFLGWAERHRYDEYLVEYKLDGASLELQYEHGILVRAVTRGDGVSGDDITRNARRMDGVVPLIMMNGAAADFTGGVRGEVIMKRSVLREHFPDKANCRNAANGLMKRKDGDGGRFLSLVVYDAFDAGGGGFFSDEEQKLSWLSSCGFSVVPMRRCRSPEEVVEYRASVMETRKSLDYDIDGLVVKERRIDPDDARRARPDRQIAFKFSLEEAVSVLRKVEWSRSGGTYTPVAVFDEVELNGTRVQRASLANPDTMRALGVRIGSRIVVVKRGEIIPKIESVLPPAEGDVTEEIRCPDTCGTCGAALVDEGTRLFCPNRECPERVLHQLLKWQQCADIRDFGQTLIESMFRDGKLGSITDIYSLTVADLVPYFLNGDGAAAERRSLGAEKVYASIRGRRTLTLPAFIAGFDIDGVGTANAEKLVASGLATLDDILAADETRIASVYGFAGKSAHTIVEGLAENADEMRRLVSSGTITISGVSGGKLAGISFCFTGELRSMRRAEAERLVRGNGGTVKSSVTRELGRLVTNDVESGSSKNRKARELGIPVIDEDAFLAMLR